MEIEFVERKTLKEKPQAGAELGFGKLFTDYMFSMVYEEGKGWHDAKISPYGDMAMSPATSVLHYAQGVFEGAKAFRGENGSIRVFRIRENFNRMNRSCDRMCMPRLDVDFACEALFRLLKIEKDWIPEGDGHGALYPPAHDRGQRRTRRAREQEISFLHHPFARGRLLQKRARAHQDLRGRPLRENGRWRHRLLS